MSNNDDNQEDWQLVPDARGKLHLVDIKSSDVREIGPSFVGTRDIVFRMFTRNNPNTPQVVRINNQGDLANSFFNPLHQTRFMIHGWLGGGEGYDDNGKWQKYLVYLASSHVFFICMYAGLPIMRAFLNRGDFNFFMVDWSLGAETLNFIVARGRVNEGTYFTNYKNKQNLIK